jgi:hypothetical protein
MQMLYIQEHFESMREMQALVLDYLARIIGNVR